MNKGRIGSMKRMQMGCDKKKVDDRERKRKKQDVSTLIRMQSHTESAAASASAPVKTELKSIDSAENTRLLSYGFMPY